MSRPAGMPVANRPTSPPQFNKPNFDNNGPISRPVPNRPDLGNRPSIGNNNPVTGHRPDFSVNNRPSARDLNDFLDLPGQPNYGSGPANRPNFGDKPNIGTKIGDNTKIGDRTNVGDVNINAGNKLAINRQNNVNSIRNKYNDFDQRPFDRNYWGGHHVGDAHWHWHAGWNNYPNNWCWRPCAWASFGTWFAWSWPQPFNYDYGTTVVYRDNYVYVDGKQAATAEQYYQTADTLAESTPKEVDEKKIEWMPLGVFAIAEEGAEDTGLMVQLAVSKEGIIAGTFYNEVTKSDRPVEGMVDRKSQRAAWKFADGKNPEIVMETGIVNLTKDEGTALVHLGQDKVQTWLLVRLPAPEESRK